MLPAFAFLFDAGSAPLGGTTSAADVVALNITTFGGAPAKSVSMPSDYVQADADFWAVREAYLQALVGDQPAAPAVQAQAAPPTVTQPAPTANLVDVTNFVQQRAQLITDLRAATTVGELRAVGTRLVVVNAMLQQAQARQADMVAQDIAAQRRLLEIQIAKRKAAIELAKLVSQPLGGKTTSPV
jgi:hypothetical protein